VSETCHAKIAVANATLSIFFGKNVFTGVVANDRFVSKEARADGKPALDGVLTANGTMRGRYVVETSAGKDYTETFTLAKR